MRQLRYAVTALLVGVFAGALFGSLPWLAGLVAVLAAVGFAPRGPSRRLQLPLVDLRTVARPVAPAFPAYVLGPRGPEPASPEFAAAVGEHLSALRLGVAGLRNVYARGVIDLETFERRVAIVVRAEDR